MFPETKFFSTKFLAYTRARECSAVRVRNSGARNIRYTEPYVNMAYQEEKRVTELDFDDYRLFRSDTF